MVGVVCGGGDGGGNDDANWFHPHKLVLCPVNTFRPAPLLYRLKATRRQIKLIVVMRFLRILHIINLLSFFIFMTAPRKGSAHLSGWMEECDLSG